MSSIYKIKVVIVNPYLFAKDGTSFFYSNLIFLYLTFYYKSTLLIDCLLVLFALQQVYDLTKIGRKRIHSLDSDNKRAAQNEAASSALREYDRNGYLEPKGAKGGRSYLELLNHAPELKELRDPYGNPLTSDSGSAFTPVHVTRKGYYPSKANYTLLPSDEVAEDCSTEVNGNLSQDMCGGYRVDLSSRGNYSPHHSASLNRSYMSADQTPVYCQPKDARRHHSNDSSSLLYGDSSYSCQPPAGRNYQEIRPTNARKYSDQDLYDSTAQYRSHRANSSSSSTADVHQYTSLECNNNSSGQTNYAGYPLYGYNEQARKSGSSASSRHSNKNYGYAKPGLAYQSPRSSEVANIAPGVDNGKYLPLGREAWQNTNLDDVFLDNEAGTDFSSPSRGSDFTNYPSQGSMSRNQVYPENNTVLGYESGQVSLV